MTRFATGLFAGSIIAAVGFGYMLTEPKTRRRVVRDSKRMMRKAGSFITDIIES
jgi:hypothetical protein